MPRTRRRGTARASSAWRQPQQGAAAETERVAATAAKVAAKVANPARPAGAVGALAQPAEEPDVVPELAAIRATAGAVACDLERLIGGLAAAGAQDEGAEGVLPAEAEAAAAAQGCSGAAVADQGGLAAAPLKLQPSPMRRRWQPSPSPMRRRWTELCSEDDLDVTEYLHDGCWRELERPKSPEGLDDPGGREERQEVGDNVFNEEVQAKAEDEFNMKYQGKNREFDMVKLSGASSEAAGESLAKYEDEFNKEHQHDVGPVKIPGREFDRVKLSTCIKHTLKLVREDPRFATWLRTLPDEKQRTLVDAFRVCDEPEKAVSEVMKIVKALKFDGMRAPSRPAF